MSGNRGRQKKRKLEDLQDVLLKYKENIVLESGKICSKSSEIWNTISDEVLINKGVNIPESSLYSYVTCNVDGIKHLLLPDMEMSENKELEGNNDSDLHNDVSKVSENSMDTSFIELEFHFSKKEMDELIEKKKYKNKEGKKYVIKKMTREYAVLKQGEWQFAVRKKLWEKARISCGYNFGNHKIYLSTERGTFSGKCNCGGELNGEITGIGEEIVTVYCFLKEGNGDCGKPYLRNPKRDVVSEQLNSENMCPNVYRIKLADKEMQMGDKVPPHVYDASVLRTAKWENAKKKHLDVDPIKSIELMQLSSKYSTSIHYLGLKPITVQYWLNYQLHIYKNYWLRGNSCLSIDATGGLIKPIKRTNGEKSNVIYLYTAVVHSDAGQYSVAQMITEAHHATHIAYFLQEFIRSGAFPPKEVVCDMGPALMNAIAFAFTGHFSISDYADSLKDKLPQCYIRIDNAHFKNLVRIFLKDVRPLISTLLKKALSLVIESRSVDEAKDHLQRLLIICLSDTEGINKETGLETQCEIAKRELKEILIREDEEIDLKLLQKTMSEKNVILEAEKHSKKKNYWYYWGQEIYQSVLQLIKNDIGYRENAHVNEEFAQYVLSEMYLLPLWSCTHRDIFGYGKIPASSAPVESEFNDLKTRLFKNKTLPMRIDDFIEQHHEYLSGKMKIIGADEKQSLVSSDKKQMLINSDEKPSLVSSNEKQMLINSDENQSLVSSDEKQMLINSEEKQSLVSSDENQMLINSDEKQKLINSNESAMTNLTEPAAVTIPTALQTECPICAEGNITEGAHTCAKCKKIVHAIPQCSESYNSEEGYGEKRLCKSCQYSIKYISSIRKQENWRDLNKKNKANNNDLCFDNEFLFSKKLSNMPILKNGNSLRLQPHIIGDKIVTLSNTCTFDSSFQLLLSIYLDKKEVTNYIDRLSVDNAFLQLIVQVSNTDITTAVYKKRAEILLPIFETNDTVENTSDCEILEDSTIKKQTNNTLQSMSDCAIMEKSEKMKKKTNKQKRKNINKENLENILVNCAGYIDKVCALLLENIASLKEELTCDKCKTMRIFEHKILSIPANIFRNDNFQYLFENKIRSTSICPNIGCEKVVKSVIIEAGKFIFIEAQENNGKDLQMKLDKIPRKLNLLNVEYTLRGVVNYIPPLVRRSSGNEEPIGHYVAICLRKSGEWTEYNDLANKPQRKTRKFVVKPHLFLYSV